jgi:TPR repeat protein
MEHDLTQPGMIAGMQTFLDTIQANDLVLIYFSGYGYQANSLNYLLPTTFKATDVSAPALGTVAVAVRKLWDDIMQQRHAGTLMCVLDASRPLPGVPGGLAAAEPVDNTYFLYSAGVGQNVPDPASGGVNPFTAALLRAVEKPGATPVSVQQEVQSDVSAETNGKQVPFTVHGPLQNLSYITLPAAGLPGTGLVSQADHLCMVSDCKGALPLFLQAAETGDVRAMTGAGLILERDRRYEDAAKWYKKAADAGSADGLMNYGSLFANGIGVARNDNEALKFFRRAADMGSAEAMNWIGIFYVAGRGVPVDYAAAVDWYKRAVKAGSTNAMARLALMYAAGNGTAKSPEEALNYYRLAATFCDGIAGDNSVWRYQRGGCVRGMMSIGSSCESGSGMPQSDAEALKWYRKAAEAGDAGAFAVVARFYGEGKGTARDDTEALAWWRKAAESGNGYGMNEVGWFYENGWGAAKDYAQAMDWFRKAAEVGDRTGMHNVGWLYEKGLGVAVDYEEAMVWYRKAADAGHSLAMNQIGWLYQNGQGVAQEYAEALRWYRKSADAGERSAMSNIGWIYELGLGRQKDTDQAVAWYRKAAAAGADDAKTGLRRLGVSEKAEQASNGVRAELRGNNTPLAVDANAALAQSKRLIADNDYWTALPLLKQAADADRAEAIMMIGDVYENGEGPIVRDPEEAIRWYKKAADLGDPMGMYRLGNMIQLRPAVQDRAESMKWLRMAADAGNDAAMLRLANEYRHGQLGTDYVEAANWLRKAADAGNTVAMVNLGTALKMGRGVQQDYQEAMKWYRKAAGRLESTNYPWAMYLIGDMYEQGLGVEADLAEAISWYRKAAAGKPNYAPAKLRLEQLGVPEPSKAVIPQAELQKTIAALKSTQGDLGVQSGLIATNANELAALKLRGERNYVDIKLGREKEPRKYADITLLLKSTDPKRNKYTVEVMADDKLTEKKDKNINEPVQFFTAKGGHIPYELVINQVNKNEIVGYLATPKDPSSPDLEQLGVPEAPSKAVIPVATVAGDRGVQSGLAAANPNEPAVLTMRGERNYTDIKLGKEKKPHKFADITLLLKSTDPERGLYTVEVMADDKLTEKKDKKINEPVRFYTAKGGHIPYELVITQVNKNEIVGYLATPK